MVACGPGMDEKGGEKHLLLNCSPNVKPLSSADKATIAVEEAPNPNDSDSGWRNV